MWCGEVGGGEGVYRQVGVRGRGCGCGKLSGVGGGKGREGLDAEEVRKNGGV